jgi:hypothetical protein
MRFSAKCTPTSSNFWPAAVASSAHQTPRSPQAHVWNPLRALEQSLLWSLEALMVTSILVSTQSTRPGAVAITLQDDQRLSVVVD